MSTGLQDIGSEDTDEEELPDMVGRMARHNCHWSRYGKASAFITQLVTNRGTSLGLRLTTLSLRRDASRPSPVEAMRSRSSLA
jgi:hypothetical protein